MSPSHTFTALLMRWIVGLSLIGAAHWLVSFVIPARGERFWMLLPVVVLILGYLLRLIPKPRLTEQPKWQQVMTVTVLLIFPIVLYVALTLLCRSPFSWKECLVVEYFLLFCLIVPLLYLFNFMEFLDLQIEQRFHKYAGRPCKIFMRGVGFLALIPALLALLAIHRPKLTPKPFKFVANQLMENVSFPSRELNPLTLRGDFLRYPGGKGTVIICHGVGVNRGDISAIVKVVYDSGYHVLAFDFRGHGESDGHTITYGFKEKFDVLGAYDYCLTRYEVDPDQLYALGISMGGSSLLLALPEMPHVQAALVDSAFADLEGMIQHQLRWFPEQMQGPLVSIAVISAWIETGIDVSAVRPIACADQINCPLTFVHGKADNIVPVNHSDRMSKKISNLLTYYSEDGIGHIGTGVENPWKYEELIQETFVKHKVEE